MLLGPSGCGKSTLLNCLAGLLDITDGQIWIKGKNVTWAEPSERGHRHGVPVLRALSADDGAGEPVLRAEERQGAEGRDRQARRPGGRDPADRAAAGPQAGGACRAGSASGWPSAGRWCGMWMCSCSTSRLSNLDAKLRTELRVEIKRLHNRLNNTMVYVTHDQIEALTLADRIAVMKGGVIQQLADPQTIYNRPSNLFVAGFIGSPSMNFLHGRDGRRRQGLPVRRHPDRPCGYDGGAVLERDQGHPGRAARAYHHLSTSALPGRRSRRWSRLTSNGGRQPVVAEGRGQRTSACACRSRGGCRRGPRFIWRSISPRPRFSTRRPNRGSEPCSIWRGAGRFRMKAAPIVVAIRPARRRDHGAAQGRGDPRPLLGPQRI